MRQRLLLGGIFVLAFAVRLVVVTRMPYPVVSDLLWYDATAWNLAQGHGFTASLSGYLPAIFRTPGYPAVIAVVYRVFGHSHHAALVANAVMDALTAVLMGIIGIRLRCGPLAGWLYALYPYSILLCTVLEQDILLTLAITAALLLTMHAQRHPALRNWLLLGAAIGLIAYIKPFLALFGLVPALVVVCGTSLAPVKKLGAVVVMAAVSIAVILPWVARNYAVFHSFPPLAAGGTGTNLKLLDEEVRGGESAVYAGVAGLTQKDLDNKDYLSAELDGQPLLDEEAGLARVYGPRLLREWPRVLLLAVRHVPRLWISRHARGYHSLVAFAAPAFSIAVLLLGLTGMWLARGRREFLPLYALVAVVTLIYAPYTIEARYSLPARPAMMLFVSLPLLGIWSRFKVLRAGLG